MRILRAKLVSARPVIIPPITTPLGMPFGPIANHWATGTTVKAGMEFATLSEQGVVATGATPQIIARRDAARLLGLRLICAITGGSHLEYLTDFLDGTAINPRYDRTKHTAKLRTFNTAAIKSMIAADAADPDPTIIGFDTMDEPFVTGGADGNTWGPTGTMQKTGATSPINLQMWGVTVAAPGAGIGVTSIPLTAQLAKAIPAGARLTFLGGVGREAVMNGIQAQGVSSLTCDPLLVAIPAGVTSFSNSLDNVAREWKNLFHPTPVAIGVTHSDHLFHPEQSYAVMDFIIAQFTWRYGQLAAGFGPYTSVEAYRDANLALGARDGHNVVFSFNILNGGSRISGCPSSGADPATGGVGTFGPNCRVTPKQILEFGRALSNANGLGRQGRGLFMWRYDDAFFVTGTLAPQNQASFSTLASELLLKPKLPLLRGT